MAKKSSKNKSSENKENRSLVSFVLGIVSIVMAFLSPVAGIITGIVGLVQGKKNKDDFTDLSRNLNITGVVAGAVVFIIAVYFTFMTYTTGMQNMSTFQRIISQLFIGA